MRKILKPFIVSLSIISLSVATVMCCCSALAVAAHFHKATMCSHCPDNSPHDNPSHSTDTCQYQLTSAEFYHSSSISLLVVSKVFFTPTFFYHKFITVLPPPGLIKLHGSPPLITSFSPLYLRTFNLRI